MNVFWSIGIAGATLAAFVGCRRILRDIGRRGRGAQGQGATLVLAVALLGVLATTVADYLVAQYAVVGQYDQLIQVAAPWVLQVDRLGVFLIFVFGVVISFHAISRERGRIDQVAVLALVVIGLGCIASEVGHGTLTSQRQLALIAVVVAAGVTKARRSDIQRAVVLVAAFLCVSSGLLFFVHHGQAIGRCRLDKCGPMRVFFNGIFYNENALGVDLVLTLPFVLYARRRGSILLAGAISFMVYISGSRTAQVALVATLVTYALMIFPGPQAGRRLWATSVVAIGGAVAVALVPILAPMTSLSERPLLWQVAGGRLHGHALLFGNGWDTLRIIFETTDGISGGSDYSMHNQFVDVAFVSGIVGAAMFAAILVILFRRAVGAGAGAMLCLVTVAWVAILERPWSLTTIDWISWSFVATMMFLRTDYAATHELQAGDRAHWALI
jgi:O-Antigen ligase